MKILMYNPKTGKLLVSGLKKSDKGYVKHTTKGFVAIGNIKGFNMSLTSIKDKPFYKDVSKHCADRITQKLMKETALCAAFITEHMFEDLYSRIGGGFAVVHDAIAKCAYAFVKKFEKETLDETTEWQELSEKLGYQDWEDVLLGFAKKHFAKY